MILYRFVAAAGLSLSDALAGALYAAVLLLGAAVAAEWSRPRESHRVRSQTPLPTRGAGT